jgi:dUTP pyrophosphatase
MILKVKKLNSEAHLPYKATEGAMGLDIYSIKEHCLEPFVPTVVETGIAIELPTGFGIEIRDRSSLGMKGIKYLGGEVDNDYRGEIKVILINLTKIPFIINKGDRVAQFIPRKIYDFEVDEVDDLSVTFRGKGGFGSTNGTINIKN